MDSEGAHSQETIDLEPTWTLRRSLFKAFIWGFDGLLVFGVFMIGLSELVFHFTDSIWAFVLTASVFGSVPHIRLYR